MRVEQPVELKDWRVWPPFVLALLAVAALAVAYQAPSAYDLTTPGVTLDGVHAPEHSNGREFHWTEAQATVRFAGVGRGAYHVVVTLSGSRPADIQPPNVRVAVNGTPLGAFQTKRAPQDYAFDIPPDAVGADGDMEIAVTADTFVPPNDLRTLGVALYDVRLTPAGGMLWPSAWVALWAVLSALGVYGTATAIDRKRPHRWAAWLASGLMIIAFAAGIAIARVWTAAWAPWAALAALTACAGVVLRRRCDWRETLAALAAGLSVVNYAATCIDLLRTSRFTDVTTMFEAAQKLAAGLDPYDYTIVRENPLYAHSYVYPPAFAQALALFLPLGLHGAVVTWAALNMLLYVAVVIGLLRAFGLAWHSPGFYAFLLVAFNYRPVIDTLSGGQLDVLILALLLVALVWARRGGLVRAGAAVAVAGLTKLHPLALGLFFLTPARWRGLIGMGAAAALIVTVSAFLAPPNLYVRYVTEVLPGRGGEGTGNPENQSLSGFVYRLNGVLWNDAATPAQANAIKWPAYVLSGALAAITLAAMWFGGRRRGGDAHARDALHFAALIMLMLLILPTSWMHYETQALLPLAAVLSYALATRSRGLLALWLAAAALTAPANQEIFRSGDFDAWPLVLAQSYKLYGVLLLWGTLIWMQAQKDADAARHGDGTDLQRA